MQQHKYLTELKGWIWFSLKYFCTFVKRNASKDQLNRNSFSIKVNVSINKA